MTSEHIGLEGQRLLDEYDARDPDVEEPPLAPARLPQPLRLKPYAAAAAGLAALLLLGLLAWHSDGGDTTTAIPTTAPPPPPSPPTETVTAPATQAPPRAKLVLRRLRALMARGAPRLARRTDPLHRHARVGRARASPPGGSGSGSARPGT